MIENLHFNKMRTSVFQQPKKGESCCGDSYYMVETDEYFLCAVADGLGSGPEARSASEKAVTVVKENPADDVGVLMTKCNQALRSGRGAVLSLFKIHFRDNRLMFAGVGNIRFVFYPPNEKAVYPIPSVGFLSGKRLSVRVQSFLYPEDSSFVIYSDGLTVKSPRYPSAMLKTANPEEISQRVAAMVNDDPEQPDDVTFIVGKNVSE
jgi:negative regulator of sigma-B (phosphoserine phosphatase)